MKTFLLLIGSSLLLSGCAGMSDDFNCNKVAVDKCLTMDAANKMAASGKSLNEVGVTTGKKPITTVAVKTTSSQTQNTTGQTHWLHSEQTRTITTATHTTINQTCLDKGLTAEQLKRVSLPTPKPFVDNAGYVDAFRVPDGVQMVWIAPFVDTDDVFHQPQIIEFVKSHSYWRHDNVIKGE